MEAYTFNNGDNNNLTPTQASSSFRVVFMVILLLTLIAAAMTAYFLATNKKSTVPPAPLTIKENAFESTPPAANPFANASPEPEAVNPFVATSDTNPFSQFDTQSTTTTSTNLYQNPF